VYPVTISLDLFIVRLAAMRVRDVTKKEFLSVNVTQTWY